MHWEVGGAAAAAAAAAAVAAATAAAAKQREMRWPHVGQPGATKEGHQDRANVNRERAVERDEKRQPRCRGDLRPEQASSTQAL